MTTSATGKSERASRAAGFTLVEVLLVLTLLVILAAIAAPGMSSGLSRSRLDQAAETLRTSWSQARLDAASTGQTLRFQCRIGENWGCIAPATMPLAEITSGVAAANSEEVPGSTGAGKAEQYQLSDVVFKQLLVAQQPADPPIGGSVREGEFSAAVLFRPDGTTSDAEAILESSDGRRVRVTLRGLTGSARIEDDVEVEQ